jgi:SHS2 domain-containing protein
MSHAKFEEIEHTGDVGLRIFGDTFEDLLANAADGMFSLIGRAEFAVDKIGECRIELDFANLEDALYDWLRALLLEFELRGFFPRTVRLSSSAGHIIGVLEGGRFDTARHEFFRRSRQ